MSAISGSLSSRPVSSTGAFEALTSEDFIKVIFTELAHQDPSKPTDAKDLLQQISTIRSIESDLMLSRRLDDMARQDQIATAGTLVGKFVQGKDDVGESRVGFVDSVRITSNGPVLRLSTNFEVALSRLEQVIDPALVQTGPLGATPDSP